MHRWYIAAFTVTVMVLIQTQVFAQKIRTRESDDADFAYMQRLTKNPNFKYCESRGWSAERLLPKCDQLMSAIGELERKADACFASQRWDCVVESITSLFGLASADSKTLSQRGKAFLALGKPQQSITDLRKALQFDPKNSSIQQVLAEAERNERTGGGPMKADIRGFSPGMPINDFIAHLQTFATRRCPESDKAPDGYYPCITTDNATLWLSRDELFVFRFTKNLTENKLHEVRYAFSSQKPHAQMLESVKEQFNLSQVPFREGGWFLYGGTQLTFSGNQDVGYKLQLSNNGIWYMEKKQAEDKLRSVPSPKF